MEELIDRVRLALAAEYPGAPNARVRDLPDRRAIRWYATTGLIDRPAGMRGRTALYTTRHLLQLVAVKRRQADGHTLAQIQAELTGATDATLTSIARVPDELLVDGAPTPAADAVRPRFWAAPLPPAAPQPSAPPRALAAPASTAQPLAAVTLGDGVVVLLPAQPTESDYPAIAAAARPLLDLLAARGLTHPAPPTDGSSQ
jgi:hypothetical protein